jgi:hypothetical protein
MREGPLSHVSFAREQLIGSCRASIDHANNTMPQMCGHGQGRAVMGNTHELISSRGTKDKKRALLTSLLNHFDISKVHNPIRS